MSYGLIHKFSERKTPSLVSFSDLVEIILKTIELSDQILFFHSRSTDTPIPFTQQKLQICAA